MATDPKTGQIINTDKSLESIRADRSAELSNPGDEGPKVPSDLGAAQVRGANPLPGNETLNASVEGGTAKESDSQKQIREANEKASKEKK